MRRHRPRRVAQHSCRARLRVRVSVSCARHVLETVRCASGQDILETWRLRTPNEYESLGHWGDVIMWRGHIYNIVINAFKNVADVAPQLHQLGYRDKVCVRVYVRVQGSISLLC